MPRGAESAGLVEFSSFFRGLVAKLAEGILRLILSTKSRIARELPSARQIFLRVDFRCLRRIVGHGSKMQMCYAVDARALLCQARVICHT